MLTFAAAVVVFGLLIFIHELGHFTLAKLEGIEVREFAIGFGPKFAAIRGGETLYSFRILPLGGFVLMAGTEPDDLDNPRGFATKSLLARTRVIAAGPLMNFILAAVLFASIFALYGVAVPKPDSAVIGEVFPGFPAAEAGLQAGDRVLRVAGEAVNDWHDLVAIVEQNPGTEIPVEIKRDGQITTVLVTPADNPQKEGKGFIGVGPTVDIQRIGPLASLVEGIRQTGRIMFLLVQSLGMVITGRGAAELAGPVGITGMIGQAAKTGLVNLTRLAAILSANLGLINLLPIPPVDGSRLVFLGIEAVRGRPVDPERENLIHFIGFAVLIALVVFVTYQDIVRLSPGM